MPVPFPISVALSRACDSGSAQWLVSTGVGYLQAPAQQLQLMAAHESPRTTNGLYYFEPSDKIDFSLPESFEGMSGGAVWRFYVTKIRMVRSIP
jgi:hypothetical protein